MRERKIPFKEERISNPLVGFRITKALNSSTVDLNLAFIAPPAEDMGKGTLTVPVNTRFIFHLLESCSAATVVGLMLLWAELFSVWSAAGISVLSRAQVGGGRRDGEKRQFDSRGSSGGYPVCYSLSGLSPAFERCRLLWLAGSGEWTMHCRLEYFWCLLLLQGQTLPPFQLLQPSTRFYGAFSSLQATAYTIAKY